MDEVFARYRTMLVSYAWRMTGNLSDAEDIVQAVFTRLIETRAAPEDWRTFLYRLTHNAVIDQQRRAGIFRRVLALLGREKVYSGSTPLDSEALHALAGLTEPYRSTLTLRFCQHLKIHEIAEILNVPVGTIKAQVSRGLRLLRERMGEDAV